MRMNNCVSEIRKINIVEILIICIAGFMILNWFGGQYLISGGDFAFPVNPEVFFELSSNTWDHYSSTGVPAPRNVAALMPFSLVLLLLSKLGLSIYLIEKIMFYFWVVSAGISIYVLCVMLRINIFGRLLSSIFYMINPFAIIVIYHVAHGLLFPLYAFLPLMTALFIYGLRGNKGLAYIVLANMVCLGTITHNFVNPALFLVAMVPIMLYAMYYLCIHIRNILVFRRGLAYVGLFLLIMLLFNFYWILPAATSITEQVGQASNVRDRRNEGPFLEDRMTYALNSGKVLELFRLMGLWSTFAKANQDDYYYTWSNYYEKDVFIFLTYLIPIFVILSLLSPIERIGGDMQESLAKRDNVLIVAALLLIGILLNKGHNPPFLSMSIALFEKVAIVTRLYRGVILKFGFLLVMPCALLLGEGVGICISRVRKATSKRIIPTLLLAILFFALIAILGFPTFSGSVIQQPQKYYSGLRFSVPSDYYDLMEWDSSQKGLFRYMSLPLPVSYNIVYWWGDSGYVGGEFMRWFLRHPIIDVNTDYYSIPKSVAKNMNALDCSSFDLRLLGLTNTRYMLYHKDTDWAFLEFSPTNYFVSNRYVMESCIENYNMSLAFSSHNIDIYEIPEEYVMPRVYQIAEVQFLRNATSIQSIEGGDEIVDFVLIDQVPKEKEIRRRFKDFMEAESTNLGVMRFNRLSPVRYSFCLRNVSADNLIIVFGESYNSNWILDLVVDNEEFTGKIRVPENNHFIINSFANAWVIDNANMQNRNRGCDVAGFIYFRLQTYFYIGLFISIASMLGTLLIIILRKCGKRRRRIPSIHWNKCI